MSIAGNELNLPLLIRAATVRSHAAERLAWHSHQGIELIFLLAGATTYEFEGRRTLVLRGGHFLVVPAGTRHRGMHNVRMPSRLAGLTFDLRCREKSSVVPFTRPELEWMVSHFEESKGGVYPFGPRVRDIVQHLNAEILAWSNDMAGPAQKAGLRTLICATIIEAARELEQRPANQPNIIVAAGIEYLRAHLAEPLEMTALTKYLGFSRSRIFDLFTAETGLTPHAYLLRLRLEKAIALLQTSRQSITDIAFATGFASGQHFSRVFRQYFDESPREYRNPQTVASKKRLFASRHQSDPIALRAHPARR